MTFQFKTTKHSLIVLNYEVNKRCILSLLWRRSILVNVNKRNMEIAVPRFRLLVRSVPVVDFLAFHTNILKDLPIAYYFLNDRVLFLTEILVFLSILIISYRDFCILINLVVYLTEHLGKIDQSLQTG